MIFFVDDEKRRMKSYVEALQSHNYDVKFESDTDKAINFYEQNNQKIELYILDIMLPPGTVFAHQQTDDGLRTGVLLHAKIRDANPNVPIIIFTNVNIDDLSDMNSGKTKILGKDRILPFALVEQVRKMMLVI